MSLRRSLLAGGLLALGLAAAPAGADVARITTAEPQDPAGPVAVRVTTTATDGTTRRLGPFLLRQRQGELLASPDGRRLLLVS